MPSTPIDGDSLGFINIDFDVRFLVPEDKAILDAALEPKHISALSDDDVVSTYEVDSRRYRTAPAILKRFLDVFEALPEPAALALSRAPTRTFNFGFEPASVRSEVALPLDLLARAHALKSAIAMTVYPVPRPATRSGRSAS